MLPPPGRPISACPPPSAAFLPLVPTASEAGRGMSPIAGLARVPHMIVFDLDDCLWHPEMHELARPPAEAVVGDLGGGQQGVVGLRAGRCLYLFVPPYNNIIRRII